jgi:hypothetical protein
MASDVRGYKRSGRVIVGLAVAALAVLVGGGSGSAAPPQVKVRQTRGEIAALAMGGPLFAYDVKSAGVEGPSSCNRLFVWNVRMGATVLVSGKRTCGADGTSTGAGVTRVVVAGQRIVWLANSGGNTESFDELFTASLPRPKEARIATALRTGNVDCIVEGPEIAGLVGQGDLVAVNMWRRERASQAPGQCKTQVTNVSLRRVRGTSIGTIAAGANVRLAESADLGRIAVHRPDGKVAIYSQTGALQRVLSPSSVKELVLRKDYLVVLTLTSRLEVYNARTGALLFTRPVAAGAARLDVHSGIAVYAVSRRVHAINLLTGRSAVVATAPQKIVGLALEAPGAVYAYNSRWTQARGDVGNVAFLRFDLLRRAVS